MRARGGLVESQTFRYKTKAGIYSDKNLAEMAGHQATDFATARQLLLAKKLNAIQLEVAASDAQVDIKAGTETMSGAMMEHVLLMKHAAKGTAAADELDGDEYLKLRVEPMVIASTRASCMLLFWSLVGRIFSLCCLGRRLGVRDDWLVALCRHFGRLLDERLALARGDAGRGAAHRAHEGGLGAQLREAKVGGAAGRAAHDAARARPARLRGRALPRVDAAAGEQAVGQAATGRRRRDDGSGAQLHAAARAAVLVEGSYAAGADREAQNGRRRISSSR